MGIDKPTELQIKEFWERCGQYKTCGYCKGTGRNYSSPEVYSSCHACQGNGYFQPDLDLNNLFKYAVPKVIEIIMKEQKCEKMIAYAILFKRWSQIGGDAFALFWAIWEVIYV